MHLVRRLQLLDRVLSAKLRGSRALRVFALAGLRTCETACPAVETPSALRCHGTCQASWAIAACRCQWQQRSVRVRLTSAQFAPSLCQPWPGSISEFSQGYKPHSRFSLPIRGLNGCHDLCTARVHELDRPRQSIPCAHGSRAALVARRGRQRPSSQHVRSAARCTELCISVSAQWVRMWTLQLANPWRVRACILRAARAAHHSAAQAVKAQWRHLGFRWRSARLALVRTRCWSIRLAHVRATAPVHVSIHSGPRRGRG
jgi:hypothetical protein